MKAGLLIKEFVGVQQAIDDVNAKALLLSRFTEFEMALLILVCYVSCALTAYLNEKSNRALFCIRLGLNYQRDALLEDRDAFQCVDINSC